MAKKVDLDILQSVLRRNEVDVRKIAEIMEDVNRIIQEEAEAPKEPPVKKQFVFLLSDPNGVVKEDMTGWVLQIPEDMPPPLTLEKLSEAAQAYNRTPKGRRLPLETVGEVCESVPPKISKECDVWVKTKEAVWVLRTDNKLMKLPEKEV
jgi:hypothetical protein